MAIGSLSSFGRFLPERINCFKKTCASNRLVVTIKYLDNKNRFNNKISDSVLNGFAFSVDLQCGNKYDTCSGEWADSGK